ncbi:MAG: hypothetical protein WCV82_01035 [Candidatus Paceibacterota bacterium]
MQKSNIVKEFVRGSENINRMRQEIATVIGPLVYYTSKYCERTPKEFRIEGHYGTWEIHTSLGLNWIIWYQRRQDGFWIFKSNFLKDVTSIKGYNAKVVHEDLDRLMEGLFERYPDLRKYLEFMFEAAKVTF